MVGCSIVIIQCPFDTIILHHHYENKDRCESVLQNDELGMRSRDPIILKEVKKSVLESLLVFAFLLCIAKINIGAYSEFAKDTYRFIDRDKMATSLCRC